MLLSHEKTLIWTLTQPLSIQKHSWALLSIQESEGNNKYSPKVMRLTKSLTTLSSVEAPTARHPTSVIFTVLLSLTLIRSVPDSVPSILLVTSGNMPISRAASLSSSVTSWALLICQISCRPLTVQVKVAMASRLKGTNCRTGPVMIAAV